MYFCCNGLQPSSLLLTMCKRPNFRLNPEALAPFLLLSLLFPLPIDCWKWSKSTLDLSPVVLVPGDGGCQIEAKWSKTEVVEYICSKTQTSWTTLWLSISDFSPYIVNCFVDNMRLIYDNETRTTHNSPGVQTQVPGFGDTSSVEYLDPFRPTHYFVGYFDQIVASLLKLGYERKVNIRGAPFDFRKAPNELDEYYGNLTKLMEDSFKQNNQRVTLIAHSMGAPVLHYFFTKKSQQWKDKYIQSVISLSGAWGGSVKPIKIYAVGDDLGYWLVSAAKVKELQRSFSSLAFLMPSQEIWDRDEVLIQTPTVNYSLSNIEDYFSALPFKDGFEMYKNTKDLLYNVSPPGVEVHCLHGLLVPTTEGLIYPTDKDFPLNPTLVDGDGDGTVNKKSAEFCLRWARNQKQKIYHKTFPKTDHMGVLSNPTVLQYITKYLQSVQTYNRLIRVFSKFYGETQTPEIVRNISSITSL